MHLLPDDRQEFAEFAVRLAASSVRISKAAAAPPKGPQEGPQEGLPEAKEAGDGFLIIPPPYVIDVLLREQQENPHAI